MTSFITVKRVTSLAAALALSGCITLGDATDATQYFSLASVAAPPVTGHGASVLVGPLELPEYLNRPQLVTRGAGSELLLAPYARWAEPLSNSITRRLASQLRVQLNRQEVHAFPSLAVGATDWRVVGVIARFEADTSGSAELQVTWGVEDPDRQFVYGPAFAVYREPVAAGGAAADHVAAMSAVLDQFAAAVASQLRQLPANP
jgi:uncharacterized lipoprotein YmbA